MPHWGIPLGKSFFCPFSASSTSLAAKLPMRSWACSASSDAPSITSIGSMTLPSDFDILRPWASRIMAWQKTSLKGIWPVR